MGDDNIVGAQAAFGTKHEDNSFTGVLLGKTDTGKNGLFGLKEGKTTFFIDANTGGAFFEGHIEAKSGHIGNVEIKSFEEKLNNIAGENLIFDSEPTITNN